MQQMFALLWFAGPMVMLIQAGIGLWRRFRLLRDPVTVEGEVEEVHPAGAGVGQAPLLVDLRVAFVLDGRSGELWVTRAGREAEAIGIGSPVRLVCERGHPANVIDAAKRPWDDVIGPAVFAVLLLIFMLWLWPYVIRLLVAIGVLP